MHSPLGPRVLRNAERKGSQRHCATQQCKASQSQCPQCERDIYQVRERQSYPGQGWAGLGLAREVGRRESPCTMGTRLEWTESRVGVTCYLQRGPCCSLFTGRRNSRSPPPPPTWLRLDFASAA